VQPLDVQRELVALAQKNGIPQTSFVSKLVDRKVRSRLRRACSASC
jgi:hypothetical protein